MKKGNIVASIICAAIALVILAISFTYPTAEDYGTGVPGPGVWPICISVVILICSIVLMIKTLKMPPEDNTEVNLWTPNTIRVYISMLILIIYTILLKPIGFIVTTVVLQFIFIQWFSKGKWYKSLIIAAAVTMVVYLVFKMVLNVPIDFGIISL